MSDDGEYGCVGKELRKTNMAVFKGENNNNHTSVLVRRWNHMRMELRWFCMEHWGRGGFEGVRGHKLGGQGTCSRSVHMPENMNGDKTQESYTLTSLR